jgi:hypothetical protein
MIGILCKNAEQKIVQEFFELFKTPWEFYVPSRSYEVVIASADSGQEVVGRVVILHGNEGSEFDHRASVFPRSRLETAVVEQNGASIPIYCGLTTFGGTRKFFMHVKGTRNGVGFQVESKAGRVLRIGFDLWQETHFLMSVGQPIENALLPTLDLHIAFVREWILEADLPVVEIPPVPAGHHFTLCLTHDVDFLRLRDYGFDSTVFGFIYRASIGSLLGALRRKHSWHRVLTNWMALPLVPLVYLGRSRDFWFSFHNYAEIEDGFKSTFFIIPFKNRPGSYISEEAHRFRKARYDIDDVKDITKDLLEKGFEIGVHGLDAWHDQAMACQEKDRIAPFVEKKPLGIRMHWLYFGPQTFKILDEVGFDYDSSFGYNHAIGYRGGTTQAFCPFQARHLVELPLHIQDTTLFSSKRMNLSEAKAWNLCQTLLDHARTFGGVLTVLWHDRSLAPERLWGDFYIQLLHTCGAQRAWVASAGQVVTWFRKRREVVFDRIDKNGNALRIHLHSKNSNDRDQSGPSLMVRLWLPRDGTPRENSFLPFFSDRIDIPWKGERVIEIPWKGDSIRIGKGQSF